VFDEGIVRQFEYFGANARQAAQQASVQLFPQRFCNKKQERTRISAREMTAFPGLGHARVGEYAKKAIFRREENYVGSHIFLSNFSK
jgi:hypothetical protein